MKIKLENMENIILDIGRDITIMRYNDGLMIMNVKEGQSKEIKCGDLGEPVREED
ncbi:MAG: hypothetical protein IIA87_03490 [Nanoarchaeota archaeon]|nr:hypothetical protein [Nanoarchaeota archaeon]